MRGTLIKLAIKIDRRINTGTDIFHHQQIDGFIGIQKGMIMD